MFHPGWSDTVNTASRMESSGLDGNIQFTQDVFNAVKVSRVPLSKTMGGWQRKVLNFPMLIILRINSLSLNEEELNWRAKVQWPRTYSTCRIIFNNLHLHPSVPSHLKGLIRFLLMHCCPGLLLSVFMNRTTLWMMKSFWFRYVSSVFAYAFIYVNLVYFLYFYFISHTYCSSAGVASLCCTFIVFYE